MRCPDCGILARVKCTKPYPCFLKEGILDSTLTTNANRVTVPLHQGLPSIGKLQIDT
uniref:Uncharacterized protein n=1 Tax=Rhizophora mucronata TaxID=61149 RepID=A0A2P2R1D7_RHIMU